MAMRIAGRDRVQLALPQMRRLYTEDPFGNRLELIQDGDGCSQRA